MYREAAALFEARVLQRLLAPAADFLFVFIQAIQKAASARRHLGAEGIEVVAALVGHVAQGGHRPLELGRRIIQGVFALPAQLVRMGIEAGQDAAFPGGHVLAVSKFLPRGCPSISSSASAASGRHKNANSAAIRKPEAIGNAAEPTFFARNHPTIRTCLSAMRCSFPPHRRAVNRFFSAL